MKLFLVLFYCFFGGLAWSETDITQEVERAPDPVDRIKKLKVKQISDLSKLSAFEDISVIQKRYLPKTNRFELGISLEMMLNNYFYYLGGGSGHLEFFFREKHGLGVEGYSMLRTKKPVSIQLSQPPNRIESYTLISSQTYGGMYYKWSPLYGKFSVLNKKIVYFDMFFIFGGGMTKIKQGLTKDAIESIKNTEDLNLELSKIWFPTGVFGFGQVFALNKNWGLNWVFKWRYYRYLLAASEQFINHHDLSLGFGINYYFPGAQYR